MSHPDPQHDTDNERQDDDLLRQEDDARRLEDAQTVQDEMQRAQDKINHYADAMSRRDRAGDTPQVYEGNGWQYGVADRPGYSDTPKDTNK